MNRPIHFEIHAANPERAIGFYSKVFGWKFTKWDAGAWPYWIIKTGDGTGIDGGLLPRQGSAPEEGQAVNAYPVTMEVDSCEGAVARITANGGTIALPRMAVPGVGWLAYGKDPEGNIFGVMQNDTTAK
jgi:hypothetical protein